MKRMDDFFFRMTCEIEFITFSLFTRVVRTSMTVYLAYIYNPYVSEKDDFIDVTYLSRGLFVTTQLARSLRVKKEITSREG